MGCNNDYMRASEYENESKRVAKLLVYVFSRLGKYLSSSIKEIAESCYGNTDRLEEMVIALCTECKNMSESVQEEVIYNGRNKSARDLADWWETHQEADRQREEKEAEETRINEQTMRIPFSILMNKASNWNKLCDELGINPYLLNEGLASESDLQTISVGLAKKYNII